MDEELSYKVIKIIEKHPEISQRELSKRLGISLGKTNYCLKALIETGLIKARNFKNSHNKLAYAYMLTPKGMHAKANITANFLKRKLKEFDELQTEIERLRVEVARNGSS